METLQRTANSGSVSTGYDVDNSLKFERANAEAIETTNQAAGNKKTWTFSAWIKRTELSKDYHTVFGSGYTAIKLMEQDNIRVELYDGSNTRYADTANLLRDTAAFYHIVVALDSTDGTAADRVKIYINGVRVTSFSNTTYTNMTQNDEFGLGYAGSAGSERYLRLGRYFDGAEGFSGYMSDVYYLNGTAEDADAFGETDEDSGIWKPKKYTGSGFGTQGFKYEFKDSSALGTDTSGEGHDANSLNAIAAIDQATDTPTNNFATLNPLQKFSGTASNNPILTEGATVHTSTLDDYWQTSIATIGVTSGKWYFEAKILDDNTPLVMVGVGDEGDIPTWGWGNGYLGAGKSVSYSSGSSAYTDSNVIGMAVDVDNGKVYWAKDNTYINSGNPAGNANGTALPTGGVSNGTYFIGVSGYKDDAAVLQVNFGGYHANSLSSAASDGNGYGTFEFAPPSGFYALCTKNLAEFGG